MSYYRNLCEHCVPDAKRDGDFDAESDRVLFDSESYTFEGEPLTCEYCGEHSLEDRWQIYDSMVEAALPWDYVLKHKPKDPRP
jgi:hypothetical protein